MLLRSSLREPAGFGPRLIECRPRPGLTTNPERQGSTETDPSNRQPTLNTGSTRSRIFNTHASPQRARTSAPARGRRSSMASVTILWELYESSQRPTRAIHENTLRARGSSCADLLKRSSAGRDRLTVSNHGARCDPSSDHVRRDCCSGGGALRCLAPNHQPTLPTTRPTQMRRRLRSLDAVFGARGPVVWAIKAHGGSRLAARRHDKGSDADSTPTKLIST